MKTNGDKELRFNFDQEESHKELVDVFWIELKICVIFLILSLLEEVC
jgi:hypothetical protein